MKPEWASKGLFPESENIIIFIIINISLSSSFLVTGFISSLVLLLLSQW
jgi:hypothetical protein